MVPELVGAYGPDDVADVVCGLIRNPADLGETRRKLLALWAGPSGGVVINEKGAAELIVGEVERLLRAS